MKVTIEKINKQIDLEKYGEKEKSLIYRIVNLINANASCVEAVKDSCATINYVEGKIYAFLYVLQMIDEEEFKDVTIKDLMKEGGE